MLTNILRLRNSTIYIDVDGTLLDGSLDAMYIASGYDISWYNQQDVSNLAINLGLVADLLIAKRNGNKLVLWTNRGEIQREMTMKNLGNIWHMFDEHQFHAGQKKGTNMNIFTIDNEEKYVDVNNGTLVSNYKGDTTMQVLAIIAAIRLFIIEEATSTMGTDKFACVKQSVYACLIQADGTMSFGSNSMCAAEISLCPRVQFNEVGYELCSTMCHQGPEFHAERNAITHAYYTNESADLTGAEMFIVGHVLCCTTCCQAMFEEGITYAGSLDSGRYYERGVDTMKEMLPAPPAEIIIKQDELIIGLHTQSSYRMWSCDDIEYNVAKLSLGDKHYQFTENPTDEEGLQMIAIIRALGGTEQQIDSICNHLSFYEPICFDDYASTMEWIITKHAQFVKLYSNGRTSYTDVYHDGNEMYSWFKQQRHTHNIYGEPTFVYDETKHFEGTIIDWHGTKVGINRGAFTEIELRPYIAPEPSVLSDIDLDWDL